MICRRAAATLEPSNPPIITSPTFFAIAWISGLTTAAMPSKPAALISLIFRSSDHSRRLLG